MTTEHMLIDPSSAMTVISFVTFIGILWWTFGLKRSQDFDAAAMLPFADETESEQATPERNVHHG
jgi:cytochrome c oxidase cbb3-type subunit IV